MIFRAVARTAVYVSVVMMAGTLAVSAAGKARDGEVITVVARASERVEPLFQLLDVELDFSIDYRLPLENIQDFVFSPDGRRVLVHSGEAGRRVHLFDLPSRRLYTLPDTYNVVQRAWSPDSQRAMFVDERGSEDTFIGGVLVADFERRSTDRVSTIRGDGAGAVWSPDGKQLALSSEDAIFLMDVYGSPYSLTAGHHPHWSPDGRRIAFVHDSALHVIDADGTNQQQLAEGFDYSSLVWSPNGHWLAFVDYRHDPPMPYAVNVAAGTVHPLDSGLGYNTDFIRKITWSPDSRHVAIVAERLAEIGQMAGTIVYLSDPNGDSVRLVTRNGYDPMWSPDADYLIYQAWELLSGRSRNEVHVAQVAGDQEPQRISGDILAPEWSSDGERLTFISYPAFGDESRLFTAPLGNASGKGRYLSSPEYFVISYTYWK